MGKEVEYLSIGRCSDISLVCDAAKICPTSLCYAELSCCHAHPNVDANMSVTQLHNCLISELAMRSVGSYGHVFAGMVGEW